MALAGNFCNSANVKIGREVSYYLVSFCDCRELFSPSRNLSLSYLLANPYSSWKSIKGHAALNAFLFSVMLWTNSSGHFCTLCFVPIRSWGWLLDAVKASITTTISSKPVARFYLETPKVRERLYCFNFRCRWWFSFIIMSKPLQIRF